MLIFVVVCTEHPDKTANYYLSQMAQNMINLEDNIYYVCTDSYIMGHLQEMIE